MGIKELSLELAAVSLIADEAYKAKNRLREALQAEMDKVGADRVKAEFEGEQIAYVTTTKPKFKWAIKSDRKALEWFKAYYPSEVVETIRPTSLEAILDKFNYDGDTVIDPNGEVVDWLEGSLAEPYLTTKFHGDGKAILRDAIIGARRDELDIKEILELEG